ncbi:MAG: enoyl-CoA hydratase/isomerase family protein [Actinobacteria bacterium]|nr:enoyl-CoA hydratase/isomerase family protein [Actinomycetota bacterium]MBV8957505.1 enoyl-CoA hydratase/isomerase family protein [Actinomycetota bacterium]MBV9253778.1 enoyl-CoA hydratase/isomerase family protein [Actinomycetota bacterium]MBV9666369.1 enoyl-CoA hydratase/isomerase family protein [Actinomycetota bacterium]MBV9932687.1 enoyl-CoA hydratase/isomerase family protein [Actinomycetota bacterium]
MAEPEFVHVERAPDGVAVVRLDRPKMNALSVELLTELGDAAEALVKDPPGAVVVWGGERVFAAGADIAQFGGPEEAVRIGAVFRRAFDTIAAIPRVTIAAIAGYALGGGCELALACDLRVVADTAKLGQPEILLGIIPGAGGTQRLPRLIGASRAKDLVLTGRQVNAEEALRIGLADKVVPAAELFEAARSMAAQFAAGPVQAHAMAKQAIDAGLDGTLPDGLDLEARLFADVFATEDAGTGVKSFLEEGPGKARFSGR